MIDAEFKDDQTVFAQEEPLLEHQKKKRALTAPEVKKPSVLILFGGIGVFFIVISGIFIALNRPKAPAIPPITPTPTPVMKTESELQQLFTELRFSVDKADPATNAMTFPPVSKEIRIK